MAPASTPESVSAKAFGYSLKRRIRSLFLSGLRLPRDPPEHAPPASLFLSQRCQSAARTPSPHPKPGGAENPGSPSQDTRTATPNLSAFGTKARRAQAPRPSVTRLIWRPSPDCQHRKTKNLQENDKCLKCNLHSVVTKAARQAGFGDLPPWISSSRSKNLGVHREPGRFRACWGSCASLAIDGPFLSL